MSEQEKQLLLKDLCARLPYGVRCCVRYNTGSRYNASIITIIPENYSVVTRQNELHYRTTTLMECCRPYLRPMSSMTEEEKDNLQSLHDIISNENYGDGYSPSAWNAITEWEGYCNARHLDFRGLTSMGLALIAPEGMYETE